VEDKKFASSKTNHPKHKFALFVSPAIIPATKLATLHAFGQVSSEDWQLNKQAQSTLAFISS
jgi:hypothetical protein